ncbi:MAG: NAD(P)/FAD-dependent oxidoreductase [Oscillospiraceae bacterium]
MMNRLIKVQRKLNKRFGANVTVKEDRGCLVLSGHVNTWDMAVEAGRIAVDKRHYIGLVNDICTNEQDNPIRLPNITDTSLDNLAPDVLVVGAGIIGCAIARELTKYKCKVLLVDKEHDVALHASSHNDGMVHPGVDLHKGQVKQKYNALGNEMYDEVCRDLGVEFKRTGQYLCFNKAVLKPFLAIAPVYWHNMGVPCKYLSEKEIKALEPYVNENVKCALSFPTAGIVCPYSLTIAYAENAADNGAQISLDTAVLNMTTKNGNITSVITNRGTIYPKVVINAAGVFSEEIARMAEDRFFSIHPRCGTNSITDKKSAYKINTIVSGIGTSSTKTTHSKGGGMVSTVDGNTLVGPDAVETIYKENFATQRSSVHLTFVKQEKTVPTLSEGDIITYFTGVRAATYEEDFVITKGKFTHNIVHAAGIQSPGLTSAPAISLEVAKMAVDILGESTEVEPNNNYNPVRKPIVNVSHLQDNERDELIHKNADYGVIVCRCEEISKGEILDALHRSVPCDTVDGIKRRVRAGMGRCQGGFCGGQVAQIIAQDKQIPLEKVKKSGDGSELVLCKNKSNIASDNEKIAMGTSKE